MQAPDERRDAKKEAVARRRGEHLQWKRVFFQPRPPPAFIPQRRKRPPSIGRAATDTLFRRALVISVQGGQSPSNSCLPPTTCATDAPSPWSASKQNSSVGRCVTSDVTPTKPRERDRQQRRIAWVQRMSAEAARRNPYLDINIQSNPKRTVIVFRLPRLASEGDVRTWAEQFGRVTRVSLIRDRGGRSRRYAFVEFGHDAEAQAAVAAAAARGARGGCGGRGPGAMGPPGRMRISGSVVRCAFERGRMDPHFLPKRIRAALSEGLHNDATTPLELNELGCTKSRRVDLTDTSWSTHPGAQLPAGSVAQSAANAGEDVDELLDEIMNL